MSDKPVLAIGDTHGHLDRLEALLLQEGIIGPCGMCGASGDVGEAQEPMFCPACDGIGIARLSHDQIVVHLGDLGHFGHSSPTADELCWKYAKHWIDIQLWGNHDRAVVDGHHSFQGYQNPGPAVRHYMTQRMTDGTLLLAYATHGFLLTHAGLHAAFRMQHAVSDEIKHDPQLFADWINRYTRYNDIDLLPDTPLHRSGTAIRDAIGYARGGRCNFGGILWRDAHEKLYPNFRQVFGHSSKPKVRTYHNYAGISYCVDVGDEKNGRLAGIWLPEERIVEVDLTVMNDARPGQIHGEGPDERPAPQPSEGLDPDLSPVAARQTEPGDPFDAF